MGKIRRTTGHCEKDTHKPFYSCGIGVQSVVRNGTSTRLRESPKNGQIHGVETFVRRTLRTTTIRQSTMKSAQRRNNRIRVWFGTKYFAVIHLGEAQLKYSRDGRNIPNNRKTKIVVRLRRRYCVSE